MKYKTPLSKIIMVCWVALLGMATFYAIESFADFFRGNEDFNYRIILRTFTLIAILYALAYLAIGLFKKVPNSIRLLKILSKYSYLMGLCGLIAVVMRVGNMTDATDAYSFGAVCGFVTLFGFLSHMWFKKKYYMAWKNSTGLNIFQF